MNNPLQNSLNYQFGLVHLNEDWIAPIVKAVEETSHEEAVFIPGEGVTTIWEITAHVTGWMEDLLFDLTGAPQPGGVDWPVVNDPDPASWTRTQNYLRSLSVLLQDALTRFDDQNLLLSPEPEGSSRAQRITSILVHNAYHAGQVIKIRQIAQARIRATIASK